MPYLLSILFGLTICYLMVRSERVSKEDILQEEKRLENEAWVNELISNIPEDDFNQSSITL